MTHYLSKKSFTIAILLLATLFVTSCLDDGGETIALERRTSFYGIPDDSQADPNPTINNGTTASIPNVQYSTEEIDGDIIVRLDMTGVTDAATREWMRLFGTRDAQQNIWVEVDGEPKGFTVYNNADDQGKEEISTDIIFLVDNSGSMGEESDVLARDIISWTQQLHAAKLDVMFGCVGYDVSGNINGAIDLTDAETMENFLSYSSGTGRTAHFAGDNASDLKAAASTYHYTGDECGGKALRYADEHLHFRKSSNRIYVNFTDEPNQPDGYSDYSTEFFKSQENWNTTQGTVHTVYSADTTYVANYERIGYSERPWRISWYTGGTIFFTNPSFTGVDLSTLPVTGAMQNSYVIRFTNVADKMDGKPHEVKITILSEDGLTRAERIFYIIFGDKNSQEQSE